MTNTKRLYQEIEGEEPIYTIDKYADFALITLYKEIEYKEIAAQYLAEGLFKGIYIKDSEGEIIEILGKKAPKALKVQEGDFKYIVNLNNKDIGFNIDESLAHELIASEFVNKKVLNLFGDTGTFTVSCFNSAKEIITVEKDKTKVEIINKNLELNFDKEIIEQKSKVWNEDPLDIIDLCLDTMEKFDIILVINPEKYIDKLGGKYDLNGNHKELIRVLQQRVLNPSGLIFFMTHLEDFAMDGYIRPGADKLTKKTIPEEFKPLKTHQSFVFYY